RSWLRLPFAEIRFFFAIGITDKARQARNVPAALKSFTRPSYPIRQVPFKINVSATDSLESPVCISTSERGRDRIEETGKSRCRLSRRARRVVITDTAFARELNPLLSSSQRRARSEQDKDAVAIYEGCGELSAFLIKRKRPSVSLLVTLKQDLLLGGIHRDDRCRSFVAADRFFC